MYTDLKKSLSSGGLCEGLQFCSLVIYLTPKQCKSVIIYINTTEATLIVRHVIRCPRDRVKCKFM